MPVAQTAMSNRRPLFLRGRSLAGMWGVAGLLLACSAVAAGAAGCASQPNSSSPELRAKSVPVHTEEYAKLGYRVDWRGFPTMFPGERLRFFDAAGDVVLTQDSAGVLSVLDDRSGERRWSDQAAQRLTKFVGNIRDGNRVISSSESEAFFYDIETGNLVDKHRLDKIVNSRPVKIGDVLVYGCADGQILGHLTLNGYRLWASSLDGGIEADPVRFGDTALVALASSRGEVAVLDGNSGYSVGRARMFGGPGAPLGTSDSMVFIASLDHSLYAFTRDQAALVWRYRTEEALRSAPVHHDGVVYCDLGSPGVTAFNRADGKVLWQNRTAHGVLTAVRKGRLLFWDASTSTATTIDPKRGDTVDSVRLDQIAYLRAQPFVDGNLYAASANGVVVKLVPRN